MSDNPLQAICSTIGRISVSLHTNISKLISITQKPHTGTNVQFSVSVPAPPTATSSMLAADSSLFQPTEKQVGPVTREQLGRATWTFIHTLGAQYPEKPTRQQKKDVKELMAIISRIYPCKECADHFKEVLRSNPIQAGSQAEFSQWLCRVHNVVNRSLGKPTFPCERVDARWGKLDCEHRVCDLQGSMTLFGSQTD
ncbi:FAD-linked sulfhydryl oxidase ERV1 isoform X1 [Cynara cardunculus var. scolymus]|uniref:Sulfhydryl oxidase n=1 Tax=Cynara cardunculus var. scolymus TaxID=59895 RepID=A0A103Y3L7_CYNCS|nr:FAD-linked sulfhydryl oxidase ERV1 isoform X1 [Cynara cardunculus var. scolymus]KVI01916.1 Erv1/Alr [Cynara cardunculus var. scolymus]